MNPRILELADQAIVKYAASEQWVFTDQELSNFALSIVRECVEQLRLVPYGSDTIEFGEEVPYQDAIKKHFGVDQ